MLCIFISIYLPIHIATPPFLYEFYDLIDRDLNFKNLYIQDTNTTDEEESSEEPDTTEEDGQSVSSLLDVIANPRHQDLVDFSEISKKVLNITRRGAWGKFYGYEDPEDWKYGNYGKMEPKKKKMLIDINIQFLIHTRYKVYAALAARENFRDDKRYKLGYLFNRLRRLMTEMRKMISSASLQNSTDPSYRSLTSLMRFYEKVVRFDVDIRDTADFLRAIYNTDSPIDFVDFSQGKSHTKHET